MYKVMHIQWVQKVSANVYANKLHIIIHNTVFLYEMEDMWSQ